MPRWLPRTLDTIGLLALVPMVALSVTLWFGIEGRRTIAALQALTPLVLIWALPLALAASLGRRHGLALVALVPVITLMVLVYPVVFHPEPAVAAPGSPTLTVAYSNVLYSNPTPELVAAQLLATDADVLVLVEFVPAVQRALIEATGNDYPYRAEAVSGSSRAIGLWSRYPIVSGGVIEVEERPTVDVVLDVGGHEIRVLGVHPQPPTSNAQQWSQQIAAIGDCAAAGNHPTLIVGDFNASRWHPSFRDLMGRGWRDAHEALGHGWSVSWPMDEGWLPPPFVRIDHALFGNGVTPTAMHDFDVTNSDHKGFVATFALTESALSR